jgi:hypothetical protein
MPLTLGLMPPEDGFDRFRLYDQGQTICAPERRKKASDEITQNPSLIILFVVPKSTAI